MDSSIKNNLKLVYIEWHDAFANIGWLTKKEMEDIADTEECIVKECGWIYKETKKEIVLFARYMPDGKGFIEQFGLVQKIPKTWIKKRIDLTNHIR